jgi:glycosyltransferase involved in cell wall biosynthesis
MSKQPSEKVEKEDTSGVYLVIPAYNEEKTVSEVIENIASRGYKIILVNDGSADNTLNNAKNSQKKYPNQIFIVSHIINRGLGAALKTGMETALKHHAKYIVTFDADGQHEVNDIAKVCKPLKQGKAEAVIGARPFEDMPRSKNFANTMMNLLTRIFYRVKVRDSQSGLRAFTADAASKIDVVSRGYGVSSEFIKEIKLNNILLDEVTITTIYTPETQAKGTNAIIGFKIMVKMFLDLFRF